MAKLIGTELIERVRSMKGATSKEKAAACGYVTKTGRLSMSSFYKAIAEADGHVAPEEHEDRRKLLNYQVKVLTTGSVLVGPRYLERIGLAPGDRVVFEIRDEEIVLKKG